MTKPVDKTEARAGQRVALFLAGVGLFWIVATFAGTAIGLTPRVQVLFDLFALAGFGWGLWMTIDIWRKRQGRDSGQTKGPGRDGGQTKGR